MTFARSDSLFSTLAMSDTRNLFQPTGELNYTLRKDDTMICHVWKFCKDLTLGHVLFTDLYHYMRIFHALIKLSINFFPNGFLSDSVKITWYVCSVKQCIIIISLGEWGSERFSARKIFSHQSSEFQRIKVGTR